MSAQEFGRKLRQYRRSTHDPQRGGPLTQARFVECLANEAGAPIFPPKQVSYWENGHQAIRHDQRDVLVGIIYILHRYGALLTLEEANSLLFSGGYRNLDAAEIQRINPAWTQRAGPPRPAGYIPPTLAGVSYLPTLTWLAQQLDDLFDWSDADEHVRGSWRGRAIHLLNTVRQKLGPLGFVKFILWLALWVIASCWVIPLWQWPLGETAARRGAALTYGLASLLIPLAVAGLTTADGQARFQLDTPGQRRTLWGLKLAGAYVGFNGGLPLALAPVMLSYYLTGRALPLWVLAVLVGLALLWASVAAGRIPADRFKMYQPLLRFHPADRLFLTTFALVGLVVAAFVYFYYESFLALWPTGITILLILIGFAIWHSREDQAWHDWQLILILGLVLPCLGLIPYIWVLFGSPIDWPADAWAGTLLATAYITGLSLLLVTLRLRPSRWGYVALLSLLAAVAVSYGLAAHQTTWLVNGLAFVSLAALLNIAAYRAGARTRRQTPPEPPGADELE